MGNVMMKKKEKQNIKYSIKTPFYSTNGGKKK
jgi:hypothetical protein